MNIGAAGERNHMADPTTAQTIQVTLPAGMTEGEYRASLASFEKNVVKAKAIARADGQAMRRLRDAHKPELLKLRVEEWRKEGLDTTNLR